MGAVYATFCSFLKLFRSYKNTEDQEENCDKQQKVCLS